MSKVGDMFHRLEARRQLVKQAVMTVKVTGMLLTIFGGIWLLDLLVTPG
jgi:hypothetical protein